MMRHEEGDPFEWAALAHLYGAHCLQVLVRALERGADALPIDRSAWENTMAAVEWTLMEHVLGRAQGPVPITEADVEQARSLHALGSAALDGGERPPELHALAERCLTLLIGPRWRYSLPELDRYPPPEDD
jgi:hypothetical protein